MKLKDVEEGGGYLMKTTSRLALPLLGHITPLNIDASINLHNNYKLKDAAFKVNSGNYFFEGSIKQSRGDNYTITTKTPFQKSSKALTIKGELINSMLAPMSLNYVPLNRQTNLSFYDPFLDRKTSVTLYNEGKKEITVSGRLQKLNVIKIDTEGISGTMYVDDRGRMIKEELLGFSFVKEDPDKLFSRRLNPGKKDIIEYFAVKSKAIPGKENISYLKVKLSGIDSVDTLNDFNQKAVITDDGFVVEVFKNTPSDIIDIDLIDKERFSKYLREDGYIHVNSPIIRETAYSIVKDITNPVSAVRKLSEWIDNNIEKIPTLSLPNTLDTLAIKSGDCSELSALLVGFLRSLGIPSYVNVGIVYEKEKFFYHAWVSVYAGNWFDTDPALGQIVADATHIKLFKGLKNQFEISKIIDNLKIDVLEYK
ncbi:MAG: transglutaminase-like domain-containing protein [Candidatus Omnitrophota bacterium]